MTGTAKRTIEIVGGVLGIFVALIAIYKFVFSDPDKPSETDIVKNARLQDIAKVIVTETRNRTALLPQNYGVPLRLLYQESETGTHGKNLKESERTGGIVIDKSGYAVRLWEINTRLENKFGKRVQVTLDSSVNSIYAKLFGN